MSIVFFKSRLRSFCLYTVPSANSCLVCAGDRVPFAFKRILTLCYSRPLRVSSPLPEIGLKRMTAETTQWIHRGQINCGPDDLGSTLQHTMRNVGDRFNPDYREATVKVNSQRLHQIRYNCIIVNYTLNTKEISARNLGASGHIKSKRGNTLFPRSRGCMVYKGV